MDGLRFATGTLSVFPVRVERVDRQVAGQAMTMAPVIGLVLGAVAGLPLLLPVHPLLGAALAVGLLALLTRGLHLDGLADLADGLGSGKPADQALGIMKKSDIGPFGVMTLLLVLLVQMAALAGTATGYAALVTACVAGRLALTWACRPGVPAARPDGLGAAVAGSVRPSAPWLVTLAALLAFAGLGLSIHAGTWDGGPRTWAAFLTLPIALLVGLLAALALLRRARRRLGGITGDVLGALVETATAATLVAYAVMG
ncbi:adenosylcobinamide-GDP ribazoletransferase [Nonomuraea wenchangensis]|uniref:adenosylcobinamide-GDP ribazoletransferase n=1 Tax=Nonomuraea wenchangensis TaxID=568860 RepID=UPI00342EAFEB